jgi:hypothetical protein
MSRRFFKGERRRPAGRVTHLAGHLFNRGGAFQAPCPFLLHVKWQDKIETPRRGARRGLRGGEELLVVEEEDEVAASFFPNDQ